MQLKAKKIAIVTGASAGLGVEFARQTPRVFAGLDEIWLVARRREPMEKLAKELSSVVAARVLSLDLQTPAAMKDFVATLKREAPEVRVLINNAGYGKIGAFSSLEINAQLGEIDLNCRALTELTYYCLPYMQGPAWILQVASSIGYAPAPQLAVYAATKAYVLSLSHALRQELKARQIAVCAVCPGPVNTEFVDVAAGPGRRWQSDRFFAAESAPVVRKALLDAKAGKPVSVYGVHILLFTVFAKALPSSWMAWLVGSRRLEREA